MDTTQRRPQLPALSYLDVDKAKRDEDVYQSRHTGVTAHPLPAVAPESPPYAYPSGPPPPYNSDPTPQAPRHANLWPGVQPGVHTPPEVRPIPTDGSDHTKQMTRHSLPSISEALGVDSQTSYPAPPPPGVAPTHPPSTHSPFPPSAAPPSPSPSLKRSRGMDPSPSHHAYANNTNYHAYPHYRPEPPAPVQSYSASEAARSSYAPPPERPPLHLQTSQPATRPPPPPSTHPYPPPRTSPGYEPQPPPPPSASSMAPPAFSYGYTSYTPRFTSQPPPPNATSGPIYQPSTTHPAPPTPTSAWKPDGTSSRSGPDERSAGSSEYGESVKRHLDLFDLEAALNEVAHTSGILADFSRRYGDRLHQTARSSPTPATLPGLVEVDDMIAKSRAQLHSLLKIREVVDAQQAAFEQQAADRRQKHSAYADPAPPVSDQHSDTDEPPSNYPGSDSKKRRGRAAPPGRCHSCNRAETPEWRRGPDGARTLCNACGLHYAKLTRKQQSANKNAGMGSSNLRPKES